MPVFFFSIRHGESASIANDGAEFSDHNAAWKEMTGLPFVFAAWVSNKRLSEDFIAGFNEANKFGLTNIEAVIEANPYADYDLRRYYSENIKFKPEFDKLAIVTLFLKKLNASQ